VPVRRLLTVCTPVRRDMRDVAALALKNIGRWRHVASHDGDLMQFLGDIRAGRFDYMQLLGEVGQGRLGMQRTFKIPFASNVDNVIRPLVYRRVSNIHPMITLVGAFAGVRYFGLLGLLLGPLAIAYLFELLRFYREEYGTRTGDPKVELTAATA